MCDVSVDKVRVKRVRGRYILTPKMRVLYDRGSFVIREAMKLFEDATMLLMYSGLLGWIQGYGVYLTEFVPVEELYGTFNHDIGLGTTPEQYARELKKIDKKSISHLVELLIRFIEQTDTLSWKTRATSLADALVGTLAQESHG